MRRRDLITGAPVALLAGSSDTKAAQAPTTPGNFAPTLVDVRRDFGAKGDGISDDWQAIENAGLHLERRGGGRMYFPAGRYLLPNWAKNLTIRNNVEYFGDGPSSVIVGTNCVMQGPNNGHFNFDGYDAFRYFPANAVSAGHTAIATTDAANAAHFSAGDIVMICSTGSAPKPPLGLFYYMEINRVLASNRTTGVITLEDPIDDGWSLGLQVANITGEVAQNYEIHDLSLVCLNGQGHPLYLSASYKALVRDVWTDGLSVMLANAFVRSTMHTVNGRVDWTGKIKYSPLEVESGSVRANIHDIEIFMRGSGGADAYPLFYCQEFTRRTSIRNIRVSAPGMALGDVVNFATAGGHDVQDIQVTAASIDTMLRYSATDPAHTTLNGMRTTAKHLIADVSSFGNGIVLANTAPNGTVENVTVEDVQMGGKGGTLVSLYQGTQRNHLFKNVRGAAPIHVNTSGLTNPDFPEQGQMNYPLINVVFDSCEYTQIASQAALQAAQFVNCRRGTHAQIPGPKYWPSTLAWSSTTVNQPILTMPFSTTALPCWGDCIHLKASGFVEKPSLASGAAHISIIAFGAPLLRFEFPRNGACQNFEIDLIINLVNGSFTAPDKFAASGHMMINGAVAKQIFFGDTLPREGSVSLCAWCDTAGGAIIPLMAKISYVPVESRALSSL